MSKIHACKKRLQSAQKKQWNKRYSKNWKKGWQQGILIGELNASRAIVLDIIDIRFPTLTEMAKRRVQKIQAPADLRQLAKKIVVAPDEKAALQVLMSDAA